MGKQASQSNRVGAMPDGEVTLADVAADPARAMDLSLSAATALLAQAGAVEAILRARLQVTNGAAGAESPAPEKPKDRLLTVPEAAARVRKSPRWIRNHWRTKMPFAVHVGRTLLFPESAVEQWLKRC